MSKNKFFDLCALIALIIGAAGIIQVLGIDIALANQITNKATKAENEVLSMVHACASLGTVIGLLFWGFGMGQVVTMAGKAASATSFGVLIISYAWPSIKLVAKSLAGWFY